MRNPVTISKSWPGVRMVTVSGRPPTRISSGSPTTRVSRRSRAEEPLIRRTRTRAVTRPIPAPPAVLEGGDAAKLPLPRPGRDGWEAGPGEEQHGASRTRGGKETVMAWGAWDAVWDRVAGAMVGGAVAPLLVGERAQTE